MALNEDTIFAPATALGGAIAVIRISGPRAADACALLSADVTRTPRRMCVVRIGRDGETRRRGSSRGARF